MIADGSRTAEVAVTVSISGMIVNPFYINLSVGDKLLITVTVSPYDTTDKTVTWLSNIDAIASI